MAIKDAKLDEMGIEKNSLVMKLDKDPDNEELKRIIGLITLELERGKKNIRREGRLQQTTHWGSNGSKQ